MLHWLSHFICIFYYGTQSRWGQFPTSTHIRRCLTISHSTNYFHLLFQHNRSTWLFSDIFTFTWLHCTSLTRLILLVHQHILIETHKLTLQHSGPTTVHQHANWVFLYSYFRPPHPWLVWMVDGDSSHLWLPVLFLYTVSGIYSCKWIKYFIVFQYCWPSGFKTVAIVKSWKKKRIVHQSYLYSLTF
jgi:hypothetical protein